MSLAVVTASHSPLMSFTEPAAGVRDRVDAAFADARDFVRNFDPDLVVIFGPDHYNGFLYDLMPPFCIGRAATAIGDYGTLEGPVTVDREAAGSLLGVALDAGLDVAMSESMHVDHGFSQALQLLFGGIDQVPVVPVFINCVAEPLGPVRRVRELGRALGTGALRLGRQVLVIGSGGLSHDPPIPTLQGATPEVAERLISTGRNLSPGQRADRERRVIEAGRLYGAGNPMGAPLNPDWDRRVLEVLASGRLEDFDDWTTEAFVAQAGHSSHETRTSIAAYAALAAQGPYDVLASFYEPIPEWIAGFAVTTAMAADLPERVELR
jgi:2,3-dihydroxyphenylpropionate 1,2-dioxygenase